MGKQGPCYHCGITTTPLWRNGPPDKPVLCNACGSRWRTKGTLLNYMPMHSGGFGVGNDPDKWPRSMKNSFAKLSRKRKEPSDGGNSDSGISGALSRAGVYFSTPSAVEEDTITRSSLGSELSTFDGPVVSNTSFARASPWDTPVPSRKRSNMFRSRASSEKLSRSLISLDEQEVSSVTYPSSDTLLVETRSPLVAVEIGLGSVFIRQPTVRAIQEPAESEATSLLIDNKTSSENAEAETCSPCSRAKEKPREKPSPVSRPQQQQQLVDKNKALLESFSYNKLDVLQSSHSPLAFLELKDIANFDAFTGLSDQEQLQLTKHLSSVDVSNCPESLRDLLSSQQFAGAMANFQQLLAEGMFDTSEPGLSPRVQQHFQQLLSVTDLSSSGWTAKRCQLDHTGDNQRRAELQQQLQQLERSKRSGNDHKPERAAPDTHFNTPKPRGVFTSTTTTTTIPAAPRSSCQKLVASAAAADNGHPGQHRTGRYSMMEEGHDSGGELDLLVQVPPSMSFHQAEELLINRPGSGGGGGGGHGGSGSGGGTTVAAARFIDPQPAEEDGEEEEDAAAAAVDVGGGEGDLIMSNTWHTTDWDSGLIWKPSATSCRGIVLPNGTVLNP